jgi:mutator protein MutT
MTKETHPDIRRTLLFLRKDDQILLAMKKRGFGAGRWNGVGGKLDEGETIEHALVRECQEEIGVTPTSYTAVAELDFIQDAEVDPWHMYVYAYIADTWDGEPEESEEMAPAWYAIKDIPYDDMWQDDIHWLPLVLAGKKVTGTFTFDVHDNLTDHDLATTDALTAQEEIL